MATAVTPGKSLRLADKVGYGTHRLRQHFAERVDYLDVQAYETSDHRKTVGIAIASFVSAALTLWECVLQMRDLSVADRCQVVNFGMAALDLALLYTVGGGTHERHGPVEPLGSSSLVIALFTGLLVMPGAIGHFIFGGTLVVDVVVLLNKYREGLAKVRALLSVLCLYG